MRASLSTGPELGQSTLIPLGVSSWEMSTPIKAGSSVVPTELTATSPKSVCPASSVSQSMGSPPMQREEYWMRSLSRNTGALPRAGLSTLTDRATNSGIMLSCTQQLDSGTTPNWTSLTQCRTLCQFRPPCSDFGQPVGQCKIQSGLDILNW